MAESTVVRVRIELVRTEEGGRHGPVFDGYRASMSFGESTEDGIPVIHDVVVVFEGVDELPPGGAAVARAWVVAPEYLPEEMAPGFEFDFVEGHRVVGHARALDVLRDPTPFPVKDIADAKARLLKPS
jgi:translation elongation factor EF-Tu-like GTPase